MNTFTSKQHQTTCIADPSKMKMLEWWPIYQTTQQTFATGRPIVFPARWAIAACSDTLRNNTFTFFVASAVVFRALGHDCANTCFTKSKHILHVKRTYYCMYILTATIRSITAHATTATQTHLRWCKRCPATCNHLCTPTPCIRTSTP